MDSQQASATDGTSGPPPTGRIDIHSHLLPSVDDGCFDFEESLACVRKLQEAGFVGSICTPHFNPTDLICNNIEHIRTLTEMLDEELRDAGVEYRIWPGGELRLYDGVVDALKRGGVPTLADSRCVLVDFWVKKWPRWVVPAFEWMLEQGYQPILAHPERLACAKGLDVRLGELTELGVWLQGNFRPMTGQDGSEANRWVRRLLSEGRYRFMALDMHRPDSLDSRLDGMQLVEAEFGESVLDRLTVDAPRKHILAAV